MSGKHHEKARLELRRWWRSGFFVFAFFTLLTIINLPDIYFYYREAAAPASALSALGRLFLTNYLWVLLTPLIFRFGDLFPVGRPKLLRNLAVHCFIGFVCGAVYTLLFHLIFGLTAGQNIIEIYRDLLLHAAGFLHNVKNGFIYYAGIQTFNQAADYSRKFQDREFQLQQAELKALKSQLNPHFLFNTLNAISALVHQSPEDADRTLTQLSHLLRISLEGGKTEEITLEKELDFTRAFLQIHQTLMGERLAVEWKIEAATHDALVPNMILQPLVENAVEHGLAPLKKGGRIEIYAYRNGELLHLEVRDNGRGLLKNEINETNGIGLQNTRARLQVLYGDRHEFNLTEDAAGGLQVGIKIPFRRLSGENYEN